jgi:GGDEF domain-containing protein
VLLLDADHFKQVNDTHGHPAGDAVLQQLAHLLNENTRAVDFVARYGGEEFAVLLPHTPGGEGSMAAAEKIRAAIAAADFPEIGHMTVSIGASVWNPADTHAHAIDRTRRQGALPGQGCGTQPSDGVLKPRRSSGAVALLELLAAAAPAGVIATGLGAA